MIDKVRKSGRRRVIVLTTAVVLAIGLVWVFYGGMSDKEGRIKVALAMAKAREAQSAIAAYYVERKVLPPDNSALRLPNKESKPYFTAFEQQADLSFGILVERGTLTLTFASQQDPVSGKTLVFVPRVGDGCSDESGAQAIEGARAAVQGAQGGAHQSSSELVATSG